MAVPVEEVFLEGEIHMAAKFLEDIEGLVVRLQLQDTWSWEGESIWYNKITFYKLLCLHIQRCNCSSEALKSLHFIASKKD